jgi:hypothetical protein
MMGTKTAIAVIGINTKGRSSARSSAKGDKYVQRSFGRSSGPWKPEEADIGRIMATVFLF